MERSILRGGEFPSTEGFKQRFASLRGDALELGIGRGGWATWPSNKSLSLRISEHSEPPKQMIRVQLSTLQKISLQGSFEGHSYSAFKALLLLNRCVCAQCTGTHRNEPGIFREHISPRERSKLGIARGSCSLPPTRSAAAAWPRPSWGACLTLL